MGNRSRYVAAAAAAVGGGALLARRRARWRDAARGIQDSILPTHRPDLPEDWPPGTDEGHAPGHQHLAADSPAARPTRRLAGRPWTKRSHSMGHPASGN